MPKLLPFVLSFSLIVGILIGIAIGEAVQSERNNKQLTDMGCAGYDYVTGEWSLTPGATCRVPIDMVEFEPEN